MNEECENNKKKISIIIPCFNCSETIVNSWESLKNQTLGIDNLECIFIDDASTDDGKTWDKLKIIEHEMPQSVMIIHLDENMRQGGARNIGVSYASAKYVQFFDSDDELVSDACEILFNMAESKNADIIQFNHVYRLGDKSKITEESRINKDFIIEIPEDRKSFLDSSTVTYGCTNKLFRRDIILAAEARFAEHVVYEEPLFVYPCFLYAKRISIITDALYIYNFHAESTVTSQIGKRILDHPKVQLELLEYCIKRPEIYEIYKDVIEVYFLWTYFCETLCFAYQQQVVLPLEYFKGMQNVCTHFFPEWRENSLLRRVPQDVIIAIEGIEREFGTQKELNSYIEHIAKII